MRYTPGQKVPFIKVDFTPAERNLFRRPYFPWCDTLNSIEMRLLVCVEHHKVPGDWEDEVKYDGFIFKDMEGKEWYNQYPRASYGQLDDSQNTTVRSKDAVDLSFMTDFEVYLSSIYRGIDALTGDEAKSLQDFADSLVDKLKVDFGLGVVIKKHPLFAKWRDVEIVELDKEDENVPSCDHHPEDVPVKE